MAVLVCLPKQKRGLELLVHIFCMIFHRDVPYLVLNPWTKSQDIKQNVFLSSYLDS